MMTVLFKSPVGITFERHDYKNRSKVRVHNHGYHLRTYRFNNVKCFESPYISWENLDCCGGWRYDRRYLETAVQNGTKLFAQIVHPTDKQIEIPDGIGSRSRRHKWIPNCCNTEIFRKGCLSDYYDIDAVLDHYNKLGIGLTTEEEAVIREYCSLELSVFSTEAAPFDHVNVNNIESLIVTGLLLGYPLESTASIIEENCL